jgi:hypothetical protein
MTVVQDGFWLRDITYKSSTSPEMFLGESAR